MIDLHYKLDDQAIKNLIGEAAELENNDELFGRLAEIARVKQEFAEVEAQLDQLEQDIKAEINSKAKALYGPDWGAIAGHGYKINRSRTGSVYAIVGEPAPELIEIKQSVNTKLVAEYVKAEGKLPDGIDYNPNCGEAIRITVKDAE